MRTMKVNLFAGSGGEEYVLQHEWPADCFVQGGHKGVVIGSAAKPGYQTAYFEAFPDTFIRGEGPDLASAEDDAWSKYVLLTTCPKHEYEPRGYRNGLGWCKHCNSTKSKVFTGEDLGQFCETCGVPTTHHWVDDWFFCELHVAYTEREIEWKVDADRHARMTPEERQAEMEESFAALAEWAKQRNAED